MKKTILVVALAVTAVAANAVVIYDSVYTDATQTTFKTLTDTGGLPRSFKGDTLVLANKAGWQTGWQIDSISFWVINWNSAAVTVPLTVDLNFYQSSTDAFSGQTPVFSNSLLSGTVNFGSVTMNATTGYLFTVNVTGLTLTEPNGNMYGLTIDPRNNGVRDNNISTGLTTSGGVNYVGSSTDGWYRDVNNDGVHWGEEKRIFNANPSQMGAIINATAVPEPATMAVLGLGAAALLRRRKKA